MKYVLFFALLIITIGQVQAQNKKILDSLHTVYQTATHDTTRILALVEIALEYRNNKPDTCAHLAQEALKESEKIQFEKGIANSLMTLGRVYYTQSDYSLALEYYQKSLILFQKKRSKYEIANNLYGIAAVYEKIANYPLAQEYYYKSLEIYENIEHSQGIALNLNGIGSIYEKSGDDSLALGYYQKSLKMNEKINDKRGISYTLNNLADIYMKQQQYALALDYYQKSLKIREETNDKRGVAYILNKIGENYLNSPKANHPLALEYMQKSLRIREEIKDKTGLVYSFQGLAQVYQKQKNYEQSIEYAQKGLKIAQEIKLLYKIGVLNKILYESYKFQENYPKALAYHELHKQINDSLFNAEKSKALSYLETKMVLEKKEKEMALLAKDNQLNRIEAERQRNARLIVEKQSEADRLFALSRQEQDQRKQDSLLNLAQKKQLESENLKVKEQQLQAENKARMAEIQKEKEGKEWQKRINYLVLLGFLSVLVFAYFIYRSRQTERKSKELVLAQNDQILQKNEEINQQKEELQQTLGTVNEQKQLIEQKNENIIASITYALRIQNAIIPKETELQKHFDCFVFFRPRDIVSGDFYYFAEKNDKKIIAVADCTGHGVSGAFMTMIGNNILNQIINDQEIHQPDQILNLMSPLLVKTLLHSEGTVKDGMDISILTIENTNPAEFKLSYAGAMNPLYYVQNQEFTEIKADKVPIGGKRNEEFKYQKHELILDFEFLMLNEENPTSKIKNSTFYLCSDGFQDQFGGENNKKFMVKNLKKLLFEISDKPMAEQKQILEQTFDEWKGVQKQTDDVLVLGIRL